MVVTVTNMNNAFKSMTNQMKYKPILYQLISFNRSDIFQNIIAKKVLSFLRSRHECYNQGCGVFLAQLYLDNHSNI